MIKRWVAAGVLEAQRGFHKVAGYKGLAALKKSLVAHAAAETRIDAEELVA